MSIFSRLFGGAQSEQDRRSEFEKAMLACWEGMTVDIAFMVVSSSSAARNNYDQLKAKASGSRSNLFAVRGYIANSAQRKKNPYTIRGFYESAGRSGHFVGVVSPNKVGEGDALWFAGVSESFQGRTEDLVSVRAISIPIFNFDGDAYRRAFNHDLSIYDFEPFGKLCWPNF